MNHLFLVSAKTHSLWSQKESEVQIFWRILKSHAHQRKKKTNECVTMMQAVGSLISGWASQLLSPAPVVPDSNNSTLDPLSTLIRIYTLAFRPTGTKICIEANALCFHSPAFGQGALRFRKGVSRNDIHVLKHTIQKAMAWYNWKNPQIRFFAQGAIKGLEKFAQCYNQTSNLAAHSIAYYILIIRTELSCSAPAQPALAAAEPSLRRHGGSLLPSQLQEQKSRKPSHHLEYDDDEERPVTSTTNTNNTGMRRVTSSVSASSAAASVSTQPAAILRESASTEQDALSARLQQLWTSQQVNIVHAILLELEAQNGDEHRLEEMESLMGSIENILRSKDKRVCEIVEGLEQVRTQTPAQTP